jgi:hypothetical protein
VASYCIAQSCATTRELGRNPDIQGFIILDNVQKYSRARDPTIARENVMITGMNAFFVESKGYGIDPKVYDYEDKQCRVAQGLRYRLSVDQLAGYIDQPDAVVSGGLLFAESLCRIVPSLRVHLPQIRQRLRDTATLLVPLHQAVVHPLATSGKKQTVPTELKDGVLDFLQQAGRSPLNGRKIDMISLGGDGFTVKALQQLKAYLQFHTDPLQSLRIVTPMRQIWHEKWTDVSRIHKTHWGPTGSQNRNPASLGHSAMLIKRSPPADMSKVDFYPGSQLIYLVLDARILNIFEYIDF